MAMGLHKPGQGYWMRVLTAAFGAALVLATGGWAWQQMGLLANRLTGSTWRLPLSEVRGAAGEGLVVDLMSGAPEGTAPTRLGSATVTQFLGDQILVHQVKLNPGNTMGQVQGVRDPAIGGQGVFSATATNAVNLPLVEPLYLQASAMVAVVAIGALLLYLLVGVRRRPVEFLIATDGEMRKVNWSTRREIMGSTWVVVVASALIASVLFVIDLVFYSFFQFVGIIEKL